MYVDAKFLNKVLLLYQIQQHVNTLTHHNQAGFSPGYKVGFTLTNQLIKMYDIKMNKKRTLT